MEPSDTARLDYALLAESARLEPGGTVSLWGGSFSRIVVPGFPTQVPLAIVGRVLLGSQEGPLTLQIKINGPDDLYRVTLDTEVGGSGEQMEGVEPAATVVASVLLPIPVEGLYVLEAGLPDRDPKVMKFRVIGATVSFPDG